MKRTANGMLALHDLFYNAVDAFLNWNWTEDTTEPVVGWQYDMGDGVIKHELIDLRSVCGWLWHCTDPMTDELVGAFEGLREEGWFWGTDTVPRTYAGGARRLRRILADILGN